MKVTENQSKRLTMHSRTWLWKSCVLIITSSSIATLHGWGSASYLAGRDKMQSARTLGAALIFQLRSPPPPQPIPMVRPSRLATSRHGTTQSATIHWRRANARIERHLRLAATARVWLALASRVNDWCTLRQWTGRIQPERLIGCNSLPLNVIIGWNQWIGRRFHRATWLVGRPPFKPFVEESAGRIRFRFRFIKSLIWEWRGNKVVTLRPKMPC